MKLKYILLGLIAVFVTNCSDVLDKKDLSVLTETDVWNDEEYAEAYLNTLYNDNLPGWDAEMSGYSDESNGSNGVLYGQLTTNSINYWPYSNIRNINIMLQKVDQGSLSDDVKATLKSQALVLRAWQYFQMVIRYGGVPIIKEPQSLNGDLYVTRNKTSECIKMIIEDLDEAYKGLPWTWSGDDAGRFTKATVMALKGRVLLYYASPQFNPNNDVSRWEEAYEYNNKALEDIEANGYGLYDSYKNIWLDEMNKEVLMVKRYEYPDITNAWEAATRPLEEAQNYTGANHPTKEMVDSYPMIDGTPIQESADYDSTHYWKNRDPRFDATIAYNGCLWELSAQSGRKQWTYKGYSTIGSTSSGFYCRKAINESYTPYYTERSSTDYVEIRYAEVILNFAECAAEVGKLDEAYAALKRIRKRAGILAGSNNMYGLKEGMSQSEMIDAIMLERKIEFAFEGKRYWDLRRRRLFASTLNGTRHHGKLPVLKVSPSEFDAVKPNFDINRDYNTYFKDSVVVLDEKFAINFQNTYYFYAIPHTHLEHNSNLKQTQGWDNGTFDPLQ